MIHSMLVQLHDASCTMLVQLHAASCTMLVQLHAAPCTMLVQLHAAPCRTRGFYRTKSEINYNDTLYEGRRKLFLV